MDSRQGSHPEVELGGQDGLFDKSALLHSEEKDEVCFITVFVSGH